MVASDGGIGSRHPRGSEHLHASLRSLSAKKNWFGIEEAIRKMAAMPAARLGLNDRGLIKTGMKADLVLFDPKQVADLATFAQPQTFSTGHSSCFRKRSEGMGRSKDHERYSGRDPSP
jgi:N-acyl-D-aspartate/D-glutamate deacylase